MGEEKRGSGQCVYDNSSSLFFGLFFVNLYWRVGDRRLGGGLDTNGMGWDGMDRWMDGWER